MKSYVDFNSEKRAQATNKFDTDFVNSCLIVYMERL